MKENNNDIEEKVQLYQYMIYPKRDVASPRRENPEELK